MILTVAHTKGGVGKTTIALNLAVARARASRRVWLVDGDRQATAQAAVGIRAQAGREPAIPCAWYPDGSELDNQVQQHAEEFDDIVIDAGGRDSTALRAALLLSDTLLVPFQPRSYDVWSLDDMAGLIDEAASAGAAHLRALAVLNLADPGLWSRAKDNNQAEAAVRAIARFEYVPAPLRRRKAFANAAGAGLSVLESAPTDRKAVKELNALVEQVFRS